MWNFSPRRRAAQQNGASGDKSASHSAAEERRCGGRNCTALVLWTITVAAVFFVLGLSTPLAPAVFVLRPFALATASDSHNTTESSSSRHQTQPQALLDAAAPSTTPPSPSSAALDELRLSAESCASAQPLLHPPLHDNRTTRSLSALFTTLVRRFRQPDIVLGLLREWNNSRCLPESAATLCTPEVMRSHLTCETAAPRLTSAWRLQENGMGRAESKPPRWSGNATATALITQAMPLPLSPPWEFRLHLEQCRLLPVRPVALRSCLTGRSVLWVGDSTTRYHFLTTVWLLEQQRAPFPYDYSAYLELLRGHSKGADYNELPGAYLRYAAKRWHLTQHEARVHVSPDGQACSLKLNSTERAACREQQQHMLQELFDDRLHVRDRNNYHYYDASTGLYMAFAMNWGVLVDYPFNLRYGLDNFTRSFEQHTEFARTRSGQPDRRVFDLVIENTGLWDLAYTNVLFESCDAEGHGCDFSAIYERVEPFYRDFRARFPNTTLVRRQSISSPPNTGHAPSPYTLLKSRILDAYEADVYTKLTLKYGHSLLPVRDLTTQLTTELGMRYSYDGTHFYAFVYEAVNALLFATVCDTTQLAANLTPLAAALVSPHRDNSAACSVASTDTAAG